ncbi:MAG: SusD/RagB family nutrient-binding outer membrane lipoprotein [Ferruginibacter sp.]|nr:SusD/RagB family nutrient-binding outer membrane lipoprotein [Ferruginibacter sp.]
MKKIKYLFAAILPMLIITACSKQLDEAYPNPNTPVKVTPKELLPAIQYQMALNIQEDYMYVGTTAQVFALRYPFGSGSATLTRDITITRHERHGWWPGVDNSGGIWRMHYWNIGENLNKMVLWAGDENLYDYIGVGQAIQAWSWLVLTDYHGEAILKEAFNPSKLEFKYDTQEEIYAEVRRLCGLAIQNLDKPVTNSDFASADTWMYGGDKAKWKKFVYGIMARSYNHLANKSIYKPDSVIYYCNLAMQNPSEDAVYKYVGGSVNAQNNYWGRFRANNVNLRQSKFITELMKGTLGAGTTFSGVDDPRRWYMLSTGTGADVNNMFGIEACKGEGTLATSQRPVNFYGATVIPGVDTARFIFKDDAEFPFMTSSEIQFMKAEAAFRKGDKTTALAAYKKGIEQHFDMLIMKYDRNIRAGRSINTGTRDAFVTNPSVVPSNANNLTMSMIMQQKFIALWGYNIIEAWADLRKFNYTDIDAATGRQVFDGFVLPSGLDLWPENGGKPSYRVRPRWNSEYVWNLANLAVYGGDKVDYHTYKQWTMLP